MVYIILSCIYAICSLFIFVFYFFFFKQKTAYEMRISDWSSDVYSSDLTTGPAPHVLDNGDPNWDLLPDAVKTDVRKAAVPFDPFANTESYGGSWTSNLDVGYGTVSAVLGYRHLTYLTHGDFDGLITPLPGLDVYRDFSGESKSAELR